MPKKDSNLVAIQDIDENWPTDEYASELRAYKRYASQPNQKLPAAAVDSLKMNSASILKKDPSVQK